MSKHVLRSEASISGFLAWAEDHALSPIGRHERTHGCNAMVRCGTPPREAVWTAWHILGHCTLTLTSPQLKAELDGRVPIHTREELLSAAASEDPRRALGGLRALVAIFDRESTPAGQALADAWAPWLAHDDVIVRRAAARIVYNGSYPAVVELLRARAICEPDDELRDLVIRIVQAVDARE